jgi:hypothetical protein
MSKGAVNGKMLNFTVYVGFYLICDHSEKICDHNVSDCAKATNCVAFRPSSESVRMGPELPTYIGRMFGLFAS